MCTNIGYSLINGKKRKLKKEDFFILGPALNIPEKSVQNTFARFAEKLKIVHEWIDISFLSDDLKQQYKDIVHQNANKLELFG